MGHMRLGRLPKTKKWQQVIAAMLGGPENAEQVAEAVLAAASGHLDAFRTNTTLARCISLLASLPKAACGDRDDFCLFLTAVGMGLKEFSTPEAFCGAVGLSLTEHSSDHFGLMAIRATQRALLHVLHSSPPLFDTGTEAIRHSFRPYADARHFATLVRSFFSGFLSRYVRYFVDRELANTCGLEGRTVEDLDETVRAVDTWARETSRIVEGYAAGWANKNRYADISPTSPAVNGFADYCIEKLRSEVDLEAQV